MDELIQKISQQTGLPADQAQQVVATVIQFLKDKLPAPIASQLDAILSGGNLPGSMDDLAKGLGGFLGRK